MRIAKNKTQLISEAPSLRFMLVVDLMDGDVILEKEGKALLSLALNAEGSVIAKIETPLGALTLIGENAKGKEVILTASYARYGLYIGGVLTDEDFFLAPLDYIGATVHAGSFMHFEAGYEYHAMTESAIVENAAPAFDGFCPYGNGMALRAPYPTVIKDRLHLFYLDERREGKAKSGMGANRLCALFTEDGEHISSAPVALPIDSVEEKRIVDAAAVTVGERTYLYYLVDYRTHRALSAAVSDDGYSFIKTGLDIVIPETDNAALDSLGAFLMGDEVYLVFTKEGTPYIAESNDLLYFKEPRALALGGGVTHLYALPYADRVVYFAEMNGKTVYAHEGEAWKILPTDARNARPVFFKGKGYLFAEENGKLAASDFSI